MSNNDFLNGLDSIEPNASQVASDNRGDDELRTVTMQFRVTAGEAKLIDDAIERKDYSSRSHLCRSAVNDKLASMGMFK